MGSDRYFPCCAFVFTLIFSLFLPAIKKMNDRRYDASFEDGINEKKQKDLILKKLYRKYSDNTAI